MFDILVQTLEILSNEINEVLQHSLVDKHCYIFLVKQIN